MTEIDRAIAALDAGELVVLPTDTVYGIAARPDDPSAVARIFALKGRPDDKPLPILGGSAESLRSIATFDAFSFGLAWEFWPGPLTLVLKRSASFDHDLGGADPNVAVRVPASGVALELLQRTGPLAVTSANRSGEAACTTIEEAEALWGEEVAVYLDAGPCDGESSTILSLVGTEPELLREGPIGLVALDQFLRQISSP